MGMRDVLSRSYPSADSIRRCLSQGAVLQQHRVKLETKPKKFEDRVLVRTLALRSKGGRRREEMFKGGGLGKRLG